MTQILGPRTKQSQLLRASQLHRALDDKKSFGSKNVSFKSACDMLCLLALKHGAFLKLGNVERDITKEFIKKAKHLSLFKFNGNDFVYKIFFSTLNFCKWRARDDKDFRVKFTMKQMQVINDVYNLSLDWQAKETPEYKEVVDTNKGIDPFIVKWGKKADF